MNPRLESARAAVGAVREKFSSVDSVVTASEKETIAVKVAATAA